MQRTCDNPDENTIGRRGRNRLRARLAAKVITTKETSDSILFDLSESGARIRATPNMIVGDDLVLTWARFEAFGAIVWLAGGMAGIAFDRLIDPHVLHGTRERDEGERLPIELELNRDRAQDAGIRRV